MVTTSADFKTAIKAPSRKIVGRMSFPNDAVNEKIIQSIEIESNLTSEDFTIGIAAMSMASVELEEDLYEGLTVPGDLTGQTCSIEIGIQLPNGSMEYVSMGLFTVESFEREQTKIRMKLVDAMYKADKLYDKSKNVTTVGMPFWVMETKTFEELEMLSFEDLETGIVQIMAPPVYPTTLYEIARHAALQCGLVLDTTSWPNSDYIVTYEPVYEGISCRQILAQIAELAGGYALINRAGNVEIKTLGNTVTRDLIDSDLFSYKEHQGNVGTVEKVIVKVGDEQASIGDGVNIYTVVDNMFVQNPSNVVTALYNSLKDIYYYPVSNMEWSGDFSLDMADKVTVFGKATYILNRTIKVAGGLTETMTSPVKSNVERDSTGKNNTQLEINRVKTEIKIISGEIDQVISDTEGNFTQINQDIDSISNRVGIAEGDIAALELTAQGLALDVAAADGRALNAQATADAVTLNFNDLEIGVVNLVKNGSLEYETSGWTPWYSTTMTKTSDGIKLVAVDNGTYDIGVVSPGFRLKNGQEYILSFDAASFYNTSVLDYIWLMDTTSGNIRLSSVSITASDSNYRRYKLSFTSSANGDNAKVLIGRTNASGNLTGFILKNVQIEEGNRETPFKNAENEIFAVSHIFDRNGYTIKDSNGAELMSLSKGVANEQNIGRADNVEDGYPMIIPFHIGSQVSSINQAILKWDISPFRTYSKGAASGGGTKTTPSGGAGTAGTTWGSSGVAEATSSVTAGTLPHQHTIALSKLAHNHSTPSHTHSVDITHSHNPMYGILTTPVTSSWFSIYIDGVYRTAVEASRGEVDLSAWITTNGWHTIELRVTSLKRIDANLFLKTYIRR